MEQGWNLFRFFRNSIFLQPSFSLDIKEGILLSRLSKHLIVRDKKFVFRRLGSIPDVNITKPWQKNDR